MRRLVLSLVMIFSLIGCEMAGTQYNLSTPTDPNPENIIETADKDAKGKLALSLTNFDNSTIPQIEKGSVAEVSGTRFVFDALETIVGSASDGTAYIYIDGADGTANWTNTAPVWNGEKQGYYHSTSNYRYVARIIKEGTNYNNKTILYFPENSGYKTRISAYVDNLSNGTNSYSPLVYNNEIFDTKNEYNQSTGLVTIKEDDYYDLSASLTYETDDNLILSTVYIELKVNSSVIRNIPEASKAKADTNHIVLGGIFYFNKGDIIEIKIQKFNSPYANWIQSNQCIYLAIHQL